MAYEKRTWVSGVTKCSAENFNHMEDGIETAQKGVDELNTKIKQGGVRLIQWTQINASTINYADYSIPLKIFWINGWDNNFASLTPTPSLYDFWCVLHIPCTVNNTQPTDNDMSFIKQIWFGLNGNRLFTRSYWKNNGWSAFVEK